MCHTLSAQHGYLHTVRVVEAMLAEPIIESCWMFLYCSFLVVLSGVRSWILNGELCLQMSYEIMPANLQNGPCRLFWQGQTRSNLGTCSCCCSLPWQAVAWTAGNWFLAGAVISFFSFHPSQDRLWYPPVIIRGFFSQGLSDWSLKLPAYPHTGLTMKLYGHRSISLDVFTLQEQIILVELVWNWFCRKLSKVEICFV